MYSPQQHQRIQTIYRMLFGMATGTLSFRIEPTGADATFDELARLLNAVAEKMQLAHYYAPYHQPTLIVDHAEPGAVLVQKVCDYILAHLEEPVPSTRALSKMFGTNEFTLKAHFRTFLHTSIYQYYNDERLKKAHLLVEKTTMPIKEIGFLLGFSTYANFYKAFKKKYHYPPGFLTREEGDL